MLSNPIEVVVIRDLALRPRPEPVEEPPTEGPVPSAGPAGPKASAGLSESTERESVALFQTLSCEARQAVLLTLATDGPAFVGQLVERVNAARPWAEKVEQKLLSHHLTQLRRAGLVHERRRGRQHWYDIEANHVRYERLPGGGFALKIWARGMPVAVTVEVGGPPQNDRAG